MKQKNRTIYYTDELNDNFSKAKINPKKIDKNYKYLHNNIFWNFGRFFFYRIIVMPIAFLYGKLKFGMKVKNRKVFKRVKGEGYFLFGNHTQPTNDAFAPTIVTFPKGDYVIVHPDNVSMPFLGKITPFLGALPLPDDLSAGRNFLNALEKRILQENCIVIYPEAHIWPYYTKIRPFISNSFKYPIKFDVGSFCMTTTYQKRQHRKTPKITIYVDGPFYADKNLSLKEQEKQLRDIVYETMCNRAKESNFEYIKYIKAKEKIDD